MKEGLVFIDRRTDQVRYATNTNQDSHTNNNIDEKYIQPLSVYYAAEDILRGQPVSPALLEDLDEDYAFNPYPYVSLTDTSKHTKCLGLAIEPAKKGQPIHIQSYGRFNFDEKTFYATSNNLDTEYYPTFDHDLYSENTEGNNENGPSKNLMYKNLIGKPVFVRSRIANIYQAKDDVNFTKGELTVDEKETYYGNHNVIQVGFIVDAPISATETSLSIEIQLEGDGRGPLENTQWELKTGEIITISSKEQVKVLAIGKESPTPFKALVSCVIPPIDRTLHDFDFIALQRIDGKTCFVTFDENIDDFEKLQNAVTTHNNVEDIAFVNVSKMYYAAMKEFRTDSDFSVMANIKVIPINRLLEDTQYRFSNNNLDQNVEAISAALSYAYNFVCDEEAIETLDSLKYKEIKETRYNSSVDIEEKIYSRYAEIQSDKKRGYFEFYVSQDFKDRFLTGSATIARGSAGNKGKAVLADIRLAERQEIAGLYFNRNYDLSLPVESDVIALHQGQFNITTTYEDAPRFVPGATYYLGSNGNITTTPLAWTDSFVKIGVATDAYTLLVDVADCRQYDVGTLPVGYMKPTINNAVEYGFLLMDGGEFYEDGLSVTDAEGNEIEAKHRYEVDRYSILFNRLRAIYTLGEMDYREDQLTFTYDDDTSEVKSKTFIIPKVVYSNGCYSQIKWLEEGVFAQIPRIPYVRSIGVFSSSKEKHQAPAIETLDISALVHYGPRENSVYDVNLEDLDIHLYIDLHSEERYENVTETLYSADQNSTEYFYDKELTQKAELHEDESVYLIDSLDDTISDTLQQNIAVWEATYTIVKDDTEGKDMPYWVEVFPGYNLFNNTTYSGFQWKITSDKIVPKDGSDPFIKFYLDTDIGNYTNEKGEQIEGLGIAYKQNPWQPPKLCNGLRYKVFVGRHEYNNRKVDLDNVFKNSLSTEILNSRTGLPTSKPVTGEAVYNFITSINTRDESVVNKRLKVGNEDLPANAEFWLDNDSFIKGKFTFVNDKNNMSTTVINGADINVSEFKQYNSLKDFMSDTDNANALIAVGSLQNVFSNKEQLLQDMFGISNSGFGGINAEKVSGIRVGNGRNSQLTPTVDANGWIPFVNTNDSDKFVVGSNATYHINDKQHVYKDYSDATQFASTYQIIKETTSVDSSTVKYNTVYNFNPATDASNNQYDIEIKKVVGDSESYASMKVGNLVYGSSIKIKNLYNTNLRTYDEEADKPFLFKARNDFEAVSLTSDETQAAERLTSALQAAYELPLGLWSYKQDESWRKRYLGIIVEQVAYVRDKGLTTNTVRKITERKDYKQPEFTYTDDEVNSIQSFLKLITDDAESGQNAITTMGMLLAAARETQERLLKLEASTFGRDAENIPGDKFEIKKEIETALPDREINQTPTYIGLNRIVRALCKEVFNSYDPETAAGLSPTVGSYRARLQDLYIQVEGSNGGQNNLDNYKKGNVLNPLNNSNEWYTQSGYYKGTEEENIDDNEKNVADAAQKNTYPTDVKLKPNTEHIITNANEIEDQGQFNGLNDAVNRVVQKLNVLTAEVNGIDNINAGPIKLNQMRENIKTAINELYFNEYIDPQDIYTPSSSRLDEIEKLLFRNKYITATELLNKNYPNVGRMPFKASDYDTYESVIDLIVATLGSDIVPLMNVGINNEEVDTATKRLYYPVSERLRNLEHALDYLVKNLNNKETDDVYSDVEFSSEFTIIEFVNELAAFLGLSYYNGVWEYDVKSTGDDIEHYFGTHRNFFAITKDVYDRVKKLENTVDVIKKGLSTYYNSDRFIGNDVANLYKTVYNNRDVTNFAENNIIEKLVESLYYIDPRTSEHESALMSKYAVYDSKSSAIDRSEGTVYSYTYNNHTREGTYEECIKFALNNKDYTPTFYVKYRAN